MTLPIQKIRILIVHSTLHIGGAEEVTAQLCRKLDNSQFNVSVCCLKEKGIIAEKIQSYGINVVSLKNRIDGQISYLTFLQLRSIIRRMKIDLVHSQDVHALADCSLCKLTMPQLKFVHTFHYGNYPHRDRSLRRLERLFWRFPNKLVSVSNFQRIQLARYLKVKEDRLTTVWNGVDLENSFKPSEILNFIRNDKKVVIGAINTLIEQKGMFDLLQVAARLKLRLPHRFIIIIAGDGYLKPELEKLARELNIESEVRFLGWVPDAAQTIMPHLDIFFQPSLWEAMSMVLLEAMAAGKTIVTTSVGETPVLVHHGREGIITEPRDIVGMTEALANLICNREERIRLGTKAKQRYLSEFTARKMAARYELLYRSILNKSGKDITNA
ncbi:glycosyl transferase [Desulfofustis limnaeus]|uniref:Glycosyl transferase n=2 Tax=Desulfofustis limnaeus TaxID=2740163 RepID=A0ABM7W9T5_9BACT|nr:glycosyl transferase [Desulfofustis limnaeus]